MLDQHAEGRAPVAHVVARDHGAAGEAVHARERVADHRRAEVAHVQFLGDVGGRVVDDDRPGPPGHCHAEARVLEERAQLAVQQLRAERQVEESRPGHLDARHARQVRSARDVLGQLARRTAHLLGEGHHAIGLVVAALGASQHRIGAGNDLVEGRLQALAHYVVGRGHVVQSPTSGESR